MFLEHVRLSPCASLNKSGCIKGSGRSKIDILHLPTKMLAQGATIKFIPDNSDLEFVATVATGGRVKFLSTV